MRVLITGMTAAQVNSVNHARSPNFPGLLCESLVADRNIVDWREPSVVWDDRSLMEYDLIIVGVAPLTALGANRAYGALSIIEKLWGDLRLRLLVDAPDPLKMESATQSLVDHPENLTKDFFALRKEFVLVRNDFALHKRLTSAVKHLNDDEWPRTIVPHLPWQTVHQLETQLPNARGKVLPVNLDRLLVEAFGSASRSSRINSWAYEPGSHPSWARQNGVTWPVVTLPKSHRRDTIRETIDLLASSAGCIIVPSKVGTWWSPRYAMSLSQMTPVFTDWHETQFLSTAWTHLPGSFELMSQDERSQVAVEQRDAYVAALPQYLPEI